MTRKDLSRSFKAEGACTEEDDEGGGERRWPVTPVWMGAFDIAAGFKAEERLTNRQITVHQK